MMAPLVYKVTAVCVFLMGFVLHLTNVVIGPRRLIAQVFSPSRAFAFMRVATARRSAFRHVRFNSGEEEQARRALALQWGLATANGGDPWPREFFSSGVLLSPLYAAMLIFVPIPDFEVATAGGALRCGA
jgi:hypothetical protein